MKQDIDRVLIDRGRIAQRVEQVAQAIARDLLEDPADPDGPELTLVPILTGSIIFVADLVRQLPLRMRIRLVSVSSYPGASTRSQGPIWRDALTNLPESLEGAHVLVIDDILDSGQTLRLVTGILAERRPAMLKTCVLLRKDRPDVEPFTADYVCFDIPDEFVVGYGLDYDDYYRNLPDIVTLKAEVISASRETA